MAAVLVMAACGSPSGPDDAAADEPLRVIISPFLGSAPLYVTEGHGFFDKHEVDVELSELPSPREAIPRFVQGALDVYPAATNPALFAAMASEDGIRIVAGVSYLEPGGCPYGALVVREEITQQPGWDSPENVRGMRFGGSFRAIASGMYMDAFLAEVGVEPDDVEQIEVDRGSMAGALENGNIDAALAFEPHLTQLLDEIPSRMWMPANELLPGYQVGFIAFSKRLQDEPELGERFLAAFSEGLQVYREGKTEANLDILEAVLPLDRDLLERACWPAVTSHGRVDPDDLQAQQAFTVEQGLLDAVVPLERVWDPGPLERAIERVASR